MNTWSDGTMQIHRPEIEEAKREARKQAFEDAAKIAENTGMKSKWGSEYELACIQIAEALRRERDKLE